ncbi:SNF2 family N-terminal domain-containing protein, partial [Phlyctochytrium arcticum]
QKYTAPIKLIVFGTQQVGSTLGNVLLKLNIQLEEVSRLNGVQVRYWNPQYENGGVAQQQYLGSPSAWRTSTCERVTTTTATVEDVKNQIDAVYQSLTAAEDLPEAEPDPRLITPLYKHQKQALHFMIEKERIVNYADPAEKLRSLWTCENGKYRNSVTSETVSSEPPQALGGILADDMGLGKTIEMISLVLANQPNEEVVKESSGVVVEAPSSDPDPYFFLPGRQATTSVAAGSPPPAGGEVPSRATLIVCPLSTVANWEEQFASHVLEGSLKLYVYHGINRIQDPEKLASYDVVLTTYNVLSLEYGRLQKAQQQPPEQRRPCTSALQSVYWLRVVLDEAHVIKERNTHQAKAAGALHAQRRWCLTGTPIHNKVDDLYSLLRFLGLVPFNHWKTFSHYIMKPLKNRSEVAVSRLQTVMKLITLRRTKDQKIDGRPILSLPPKTTSVYKLTLEATEQALYDRVFERARTVFRELDSSGKVFKHYATLLELLLRLRQVVTHPALYRDQGGLSDPIRDLEQGEDHPLLTAQRAAHIMSLLRDAGHDKCSLCSTMVDGNGDRVPVVSRCGHLFCDECTRDVLDGNSTLNCFLCSSVLTKGDILEIKDIDAAQDMDDALLSTHHAVPNEPSTPSLSTKVRTLLDDLLRVQRETRQNNQPPIKSIVFSQWTHMLDLIQPALTSCRIGYCRLDGKMSRHERTLAMDRLKFDPTVTVMLVSLKAGGVGLNLTSASRVYILEPYWNPAVEDQAQDRVHRMGQTRPVHVIRFVVEDSIEEVIESMKRRKRELVATAFKTEGKSEVEVDGSGSQGGNRGRGVKEKAELQQRKLNDLRALFGFKDS